MQIPILVEPLGDGTGYVAKTGEPLGIRVEKPTAEDAVMTARKLIAERFQCGARFEIVQFPTVPILFTKPEPLPDDELTREWRAAIEEYRREVDEADERLLAEELNADSP